MRVYIYLGLALFGFLTPLLGPVLNIFPRRPNWEGYSDPAGYFMISVFSFVLADDLVKQIHPQGAGPEHAFPSLAYIAFVLFGLSVIGAAFGILRRTSLIRRWIIFPTIALGIICGFALNLHGEVDKRVAFAVYSVPQLLLLFAKKREDTTPANPGPSSGSVGNELL
jgi:hypothetical protein